MLPEIENIPKAYSLDIHLDIQLNIGLNIHHVLYIFGVCLKRIYRIANTRLFYTEQSIVPPVFNGPISVTSQVLTILPETENPRFNPCYYSTVYGVSPRSFPLEVSAEIPWTPQENLQELTLGEFVIRYEVVEKSSLTPGREEYSYYNWEGSDIGREAKSFFIKC